MGLANAHLETHTRTHTHRLKGFLQIYQLQTENDEEETWRDLVRGVVMQPDSSGHSIPQSTHGFDRMLKLVTTRREEEVEAHGRII